MLGERLTNTLSNYTSLPRKRNRLCIFGKEIKSEYDGIDQAEDRNGKKEDRNHKGEDKSYEGEI